MISFCDLQVRIDHRSGTVNFGKLQLESDKIRDHIALFSQSLSKSVDLMFPSIKPGYQERKIKVRCPQVCVQTMAIVKLAGMRVWPLQWIAMQKCQA